MTPRTRRVALILNAPVADERTITALQLAERLRARGVRVTVFAHDHAAAISAGDGEVAHAIESLLRRGVHGGTLDWVVEADATKALGVEDTQARGIVSGDHADLWAFVREADVVLSVGGDR